jgi:hypothetical protein
VPYVVNKVMTCNGLRLMPGDVFTGHVKPSLISSRHIRWVAAVAQQAVTLDAKEEEAAKDCPSLQAAPEAAVASPPPQSRAKPTQKTTGNTGRKGRSPKR